MMNHSYEEALSKQSKGILSLQKKIEYQNQKIIDEEHKHSEKAACVSKLIVGLKENIDSRQRSLLEMEHKYNESLNMVMKLMSEGDALHEKCYKEVQRMKVMNSNMNHDMECIKKEHRQITKDLEERKALNDLQQKNFTEEIQNDFLKTVDALCKDIREKEQSLQDLDALNRTLIISESKSNDEMQEARKELIKRMGELDKRPFLDAMKKKYNEEEAEERASELCSLWEEFLIDPDWHPFKVITVEG